MTGRRFPPPWTVVEHREIAPVQRTSWPPPNRRGRSDEPAAPQNKSTAVMADGAAILCGDSRIGAKVAHDRKEIDRQIEHAHKFPQRSPFFIAATSR
jgi:hypothetical protein